MASTGDRLDVLDPGTPSDQWAQNVLSTAGNPNTSTSTGYGAADASAYGNISFGSSPVGSTVDSAADRIASSDRPAAGRGGSGEASVGVDTARPTTSLATSLNEGYQQPPITTNAVTEPGPNVSVSNNSTASGPGGSQSGNSGADGSIGQDYSSRNQGALQKTPSSTNTEDILSTQPKSTAPGQPIADPLSHRPENQASTGTNLTTGNTGARSNYGSEGQDFSTGGTSGYGTGVQSADYVDASGDGAGGLSREPASSSVPAEPSAKTLSTLQSSTDQTTSDIIGPEPKWRNPPQPESVGGSDLPQMGVDTTTSSGGISSDPSARTRAALSTDPSKSTTHSVLGSQPKKTAPGEPIVPPKSTSLDDQSAGAGGDSAYLGGSSDPTRPYDGGGLTAGSTGGVPGVEKRTTGISSEPSARTKAALGQNY